MPVRSPESRASRRPAENRLLARLAPDLVRRLLRRAKGIHLKYGETLYDLGDPIQFVYFPTSAVVSLLTIMSDGRCIESATIGREGVLGVPTFLGVQVSVIRVLVQVSGEAFRVPVEDFREAVEDRTCRALIGRYAHALFTHIFRSAGCNRLHTAEQRCARWLLEMQDRAQCNQFHLTHQFLSDMLGVHRQQVTVIIAKLQKAGLLSYKRGRISILDRLGLELAACEDYAIVKEELRGFSTRGRKKAVVFGGPYTCFCGMTARSRLH